MRRGCHSLPIRSEAGPGWERGMTASIQGVSSLLYFVSELNEYDREGGLDEVVEKYDPLSREDWAKLFVEVGFLRYGFRHGPSAPVEYGLAGEAAMVLAERLGDDGFDWGWLLKAGDDHFFFPPAWGEVDAKLIFQEAYRAVFLAWGARIRELGIWLPLPSEIGIPPEKAQ